MLLSELIQEDLIKVGLKARDKWDAIRELVDVLVAAHEIRLNDRTTVIDAVVTRERSLSTGLKYGLAVPHGTVDCVTDIIVALGTSPEGEPLRYSLIQLQKSNKNRARRLSLRQSRRARCAQVISRTPRREF